MRDAARLPGCGVMLAGRLPSSRARGLNAGGTAHAEQSNAAMTTTKAPRSTELGYVARAGRRIRDRQEADDEMAQVNELSARG